MIQRQIDNFSFLTQFWPDLYDLGRKAELAAATDPEITAIRLRAFSEGMVEYLFQHFEMPLLDGETQFDRLMLLEKGDLLDARLLAKLHAIRKIGNRGAHGKTVTLAQAQDLVADAWSLACWFCRLLRPDIGWPSTHFDTPSVRVADAPSPAPTAPDRQSTASTTTTNILKFPEERIRRIRDEVARAMALVDPSIRRLRTRITMREAFVEDLNQDQGKCVDALEAFLADRTKRIFLLKGDAGTGKTFLAKGLVEYLSSQGRASQIAAPTGRAAKIIGAKTGRDARTLHSLIYDYRDMKEYGEGEDAQGLETFKVYADVAANRDQANAVYIIDEASLVSDAYSESEFFRSGSGYLLRDLMSYVGLDQTENDRKIIFLGDPAQLTPVGMNTSPALDIAYLSEHFGQDAAEYRLREVVRQKAGSGVLRNVGPLRDGLDTKTFRGLRFEFDDDVRRLSVDEVLAAYMEIQRTGGDELPIIVTRSNREAADFNRSVRSRLFPGQEMVASGDRLIVTSNTLVGGRFLANGEFVQVAGAEPLVERRTVTLKQRDGDRGDVRTLEVDLLFRDIDIAVPLPDGTEAVQQVKVLDGLLHDRNATLSVEHQRALYVDFLKRHPDLRRGDPRLMAQVIRQDPYFNAVRAKFGYAVTCHKAQGGEWGHVFVACPGGQDPRSPDYFRWLYTAMTRSSSKLYLIDPPEIRIQVAGGLPIAGSHIATQAGAKNQPEGEAPSLSPLAAFQQGLLDRVREMLTRTGITIDDVAHHQYQEAMYLSRGSDACRANVSYNARFKIGAVATGQANAFAQEVAMLLGPLTGQSLSNPPSPGPGAAAAATTSPSRPFLKEFHDRLTPLMGAREITVASLKEQQWSQRYTFARSGETAIVDIYYDGRDRFTRCMPIAPKAPSGLGSRSLLPDVLDVITTEIVP